MYKKIFVSTALILASINLNYADVLIQWNLPTSSLAISVNATSTALGLKLGSALIMGSGLTPTTYPTGWGGTSWTTSGTPLQASQANNYFAFDVSPETGNDVLINGAARLVLYHSASGPQFYDFLYSNSIDFSTYQTYASFDLGGSGSVVNLDVTDSLTSALAANPIQITSGNTGYFRIVGYGAISSVGAGRIVSDQSVDFGLNGSISSSSVPEPSSLSLLALGVVVVALRRRKK
jgi:hypothetical protein